MRRMSLVLLLCCTAIAGCEKPELVRYPGDPPSSPGTAQNTPPTVNAGADVTIAWPIDSVQLAATATDDGLPTANVRYSWVSEPNGVTFENPMSLLTSVRFPAPGTYQLTLTADDGALQSSDVVTIRVQPENNNTAPVVSAGADQSTEIPKPVTLQGSATDDGVPTTPLTLTWTRLNGPGDVTFADAASATTTVTFSAPGSYELQLSATDGELTSSDVVLVIVTAAFYPAPDLSDDDPDHGWTRVDPAEVGMDAAPLAQAQAYAEQAGGAGLISRYGRIVHSWGDIDQRYDLKSTTKSIASLALGILIDEGRVLLEDRAVTHLPTMGIPPATNDPAQLQEITLAQLAIHTAGFDKPGGYVPLLAPPGTQWRYSDAGLNWLADTLTTVYGDDLDKLLATRVYPIIGVNTSDTDMAWRNPSVGLRPDPRPNGIIHREFASGIIANVNSLARVGLLFLRRGEWSDQRVVSESFVDIVRTPRGEAASATVVDPIRFAEANQRYGVLWWTNATGALPNVPRDAYWAWGLYDSLVVVIPSLDLVIVRAGPVQPAVPNARTFGEGDWDATYEVLAPFLDPIVGAVER